MSNSDQIYCHINGQNVIGINEIKTLKHSTAVVVRNLQITDDWLPDFFAVTFCPLVNKRSSLSKPFILLKSR